MPEAGAEAEAPPALPLCVPLAQGEAEGLGALEAVPAPLAAAALPAPLPEALSEPLLLLHTEAEAVVQAVGVREGLAALLLLGAPGEALALGVTLLLLLPVPQALAVGQAVGVVEGEKLPWGLLLGLGGPVTVPVAAGLALAVRVMLALGDREGVREAVLVALVVALGLALPVLLACSTTALRAAGALNRPRLGATARVRGCRESQDSSATVPLLEALSSSALAEKVVGDTWYRDMAEPQAREALHSTATTPGLPLQPLPEEALRTNTRGAAAPL